MTGDASLRAVLNDQKMRPFTSVLHVPAMPLKQLSLLCESLKIEIDTPCYCGFCLPSQTESNLEWTASF